MIDERKPDGTGWAQFSDDRKHRYRLARALNEPARHTLGGQTCACNECAARIRGDWRPVRAVFVLLNPSTADAFKPDPTVTRCMEFARRMNADVVEVVNLFSIRSSVPAVLYEGARVAAGQCGDYSHVWRSGVGADGVNDVEILDACHSATRVIAAWGNHGVLADRDSEVMELLVGAGVKLESLRILPNGNPSHPLARGKSFIPYDVTPVAFA